MRLRLRGIADQAEVQKRLKTTTALTMMTPPTHPSMRQTHFKTVF
jgi:hypothetical protein